MPATGPNFSPYPFERLRRITRAEAAFESAIARWLAAAPVATAPTLTATFGPPRVRVIGVLGAGSARPDAHAATLRVLRDGTATVAADVASSSEPSGTVAASPHARRTGPRSEGAGYAMHDARDVDRFAARHPIDPYAALAEVRIDGLSITLAASSLAIRALAERTLANLDELAAPRPLTPTEHAVWCLVVATALHDLGIPGQAWPLCEDDRDLLAAALRGGAPDARAIELAVSLGDVAMTVVALVPAALALRVPPRPRDLALDVPIVVARAAVPIAAVGGLAVRDIITVERTLELAVGDISIPLRAAPRAVEATVATGYVRRDMALPDDAHVELTVQLGTRRMSVRELADLAVGSIVPLGRPLAGPFDVRAGGRLVGQGELIDIDGELGVRIVSIVSE